MPSTIKDITTAAGIAIPLAGAFFYVAKPPSDSAVAQKQATALPTPIPAASTFDQKLDESTVVNVVFTEDGRSIEIQPGQEVLISVPTDSLTSLSVPVPHDQTVSAEVHVPHPQ